MNILITNDDSIHNKGIWYLWEALKDKHNVTVVAPPVLFVAMVWYMSSC
jgi:5'/3'-nucleotidase SurE